VSGRQIDQNDGPVSSLVYLAPLHETSTNDLVGFGAFPSWYGCRPARRPASAAQSRFRIAQIMIVGVDRFAPALHNKFDVVRLQVAPALDLGQISILREALEVIRAASCLAAVRSLVNFSRTRGSCGIGDPFSPRAARRNQPRSRAHRAGRTSRWGA
jgi:hypothetical protein